MTRIENIIRKIYGRDFYIETTDVPNRYRLIHRTGLNGRGASGFFEAEEKEEEERVIVKIRFVWLSHAHRAGAIAHKVLPQAILSTEEVKVAEGHTMHELTIDCPFSNIS